MTLKATIQQDIHGGTRSPQCTALSAANTPRDRSQALLSETELPASISGCGCPLNIWTRLPDCHHPTLNHRQTWTIHPKH